MDQESIQELAPEEALDSPKGGPAETKGLTQSTPLNSLEVRIPVNPSHSGHNSPLRSYMKQTSRQNLGIEVKEMRSWLQELQRGSTQNVDHRVEKNVVARGNTDIPLAGC